MLAAFLLLVATLFFLVLFRLLLFGLVHIFAVLLKLPFPLPFIAGRTAITTIVVAGHDLQIQLMK